MNRATLHLGDCLSVLRSLDAESIDAVVTDPPYGIGFPYRTYIDTRENLCKLIEEFVPECRRVAKRVFILCGPTQIGLYPQADWVSACTWKTTGSFGRFGYNQWTPVLCYGKDLEGFGRVNGILKSDVLAIAGGGGVGAFRTETEKKHTCPKPITMMDLVIQRFTREGETVLDPFAGSGTTGVSCLRNRRRFIGIEIDPEYHSLSRRRLDDAEREAATFLPFAEADLRRDFFRKGTA